MQFSLRTVFLVSIFFVLGGTAFAQGEIHQDIQGTWRARVVNIIAEETREVPGTVATQNIQVIEAELLEGPRKGEHIELENDFVRLEEGDAFFMNYLVTVNGEEFYGVQAPDRRGALLFFAILFVCIVLVFGGLQGLRSLIALAGSFLIIFYILFPQLLAGAPPIVVSALFSIGILILAIFVTHGVNRTSTAALLGTIITILITIAFAEIAVRATRLSGFVEDASVYLNLNTGGKLDFQGLLLGAIVIGVLGILDDIAITQASTVKELHHAAPHLSRREIYAKALRVGREHVGALVNTLALAYTGAALPLLLLFSNAQSWSLILNREIFAAEIIRTIVGSTGVILAVPITTLIAVMLLIKKDPSGTR